MKTVILEKLLELQSQAKSIRNICILAHVDHGKTTLADALVASNGIISNRLAGKLRYLDSLPEEQLRGITMKSSAISLLFKNAADSESYLINLIDSPGHIDFSSEVSTAVRLCDGALVIVDVVEGVCPQTHAVLRQAWLEGIKPCLVLNKIDRLITELKQSPLEAFMHLQKILEQVNAVTGTLFSSDILEKTSQNQKESKVVGGERVFDWSSGLEHVDDSSLYFSPDQGNVVFASAIHGWGFRVSDFAELYSKKLGIRSDVLVKTLWGDYFLHNKFKRIMKGAQAKAKKPLFVQFILNYIWEIYDAVCIRRDKERIEKIVQSLNLKISARDSRQSDSKAHLQAIFHQWLPLSKAVLQMVVEKLPSAEEISSERVENLMCSGLRTFESLPEQTKNLKGAFLNCSSEDGAPVIIFVSKMFAVDKHILPQNKRRPLTREELTQRREQARLKHSEMLSGMKEEPESLTAAGKPEEVVESNQDSNASEPHGQFIAFARVYSGVIRKGQKLYVLGPKYDPCEEGDDIENEVEDLNGEINLEQRSEGLLAAQSVDRRETGKHVASFTVKNLYLLMGRELEALDMVPAGNVLGIGGLENYILKSATISNTLACPPFTALPFDVRPIVRVAIEPVHPSNMSALRRGMCLLNQADPIVEVLVQQTGEYVLVGTGEVHIQRCVDDLKKRYANVELRVSDPIIPFRETIVPPPKVDMVNEIIQNESGKTTHKDREKNEVQQLGSGYEQNKSEQVVCGNISELKKGLYRAQTGNKRCSVLIRACPLPEAVTQLLDSSTSLLKDLQSLRKSAAGSGPQVNSTIKGSALETLKDFYEKLKMAFEESGSEWEGVVERIWAFGPRHVGPNILLNKIPGYKRPSMWKAIANQEEQTDCESSYREYDNSIINGFQLAASAGPLCEEPLMGVCFVIENILIDYGESEANLNEIEKSLPSHVDGCNKNDILSEDVANSCYLDDNKDVLQGSQRELDTLSDNNKECLTSEANNLSRRKTLFGILSGQIISTVKDGCRQAFSLQPMRLMAAMYTCTIQTPADVLGKMYAVISKREGRVLGEEMKEGSDVFLVNAVLPVAESFGFSEEIRKKTSGLARPLLQFTHWEVIDIDPYWVPTTEEEYLHFGEKADSENQARKYMNSVRRRKGLYVKAKTVEHAEKQRTLKK